MEFYLELDRVVREISKRKAKAVLIQLPDGLKPKAGQIADEIEKKTDADVFIWEASCFGACDTPDVKGIDLLVQWGHSEWR
jgi:2-(3-amino-3-carboxypropyl)histidine synthase